LIITDIEMPKLNGIDLITAYRKINIDVPIIVTTAYERTDYLLACANLNIQGYLLKPITHQGLKNTLEKALHYIKGDDYVRLKDGVFYDKAKNCIINSSQKFKLTKEERLILNLLLTNKGMVTQYRDIEETIWEHYDKQITKTALRTLIKKLRQKCGKDILSI